MDKSASIRGIVVIVSALALALWLGVTIVTNQSETLLKVSVASLFIICLFLGRKIWLLLIFFSALSIPVIRGFSTNDIGQMLFVGFTTAIFLMRRQPFNFKFEELEMWMLLMAACVVQVYLRNPVGLNLFGSNAVGARPYFAITLAFVTGMLLGNIVVNPSEIKWAVRLTIVGSFLGIGLSTLRMRGVGQTGFVQGTQIDDGQGSNRIGSLGQIGFNMARIISSYLSPLRACIHPVWAPLIILSVAAAAGSGFRNAVASVGLTYLIGIAYRSGIPGVMFSVISATMGLGLLAIINVASPLPPNIQRALSPFPGTWEKRHVDAAEESTEWRVEMWKEALFTEYWIHNKILGDGLGFTRKELEMMEAMEAGTGGGLDSRSSGMSQQQEAMMITGGYHSGPVQTVRIVGYVGLAILILSMIRVAVHAHRQIIRCRGTEWYPIALFIGIPIITLPPFFILIFGDFGRDASAVFISYGMIRLLEKNLPLPAYVKRTYRPFILNKQDIEAANARRLHG